MQFHLVDMPTLANSDASLQNGNASTLRSEQDGNAVRKLGVVLQVPRSRFGSVKTALTTRNASEDSGFVAALKVPGVHRERKTVASQICDRRGYYHGRGSLYGESEQSKRIAVRGLKPVVISAANGNHFKNGGKVTCVEKALR